MNDKLKLVVNCPLCGEKELNIISSQDELMQCLSCGYSTNNSLTGKMSENEEFNKMDKEIRHLSKEQNDQIWTPSILNLPLGLLHPSGKKHDGGYTLKWTFSPLIDVKDEEKENYKKEDGTFYSKRYDMDNQVFFDNFGQAILEINTIHELRRKHESGELSGSKPQEN